MPTPLTDADKVLRNDTGKDIVTQLTSIASSIATPASLVGLYDTAITTPTDGQELTYNSSLSKWNNKTTRVELTQQQYDLLVANNEDLPDVDYYITDAGGAEVVSSAPNISDVYNPNTKYNTGNLCIYNNVLYKCKTDSVTGTWDSTKWDRTTIEEILSAKAFTTFTHGAYKRLTNGCVMLYLNGATHQASLPIPSPDKSYYFTGLNQNNAVCGFFINTSGTLSIISSSTNTAVYATVIYST